MKWNNILRTRSITLGLVLSCLLIGQVWAAQQTETFTVTAEELENSGADTFDLFFALGGVNITIVQSDETDVIIEAVVTYDTQGATPFLNTSSTGKTFSADFSSGYEFDYDYDLHRIQTWEITVGSYDVDTELMLAGGGFAGDIDLGGMPLADCNMTLGGGEINVDFSKPTTRRVAVFSVEGGGLGLSITNIGNTDFERFSLVGGGFSADLDFNGTYTSGNHTIDIIGAGNTLDIALPADAGAKVDAISVGSLLTVRGSGWRMPMNLFFFKNYITRDYTSQDVTLDMELIGAGSLVSIDRD